MRRCRFQTFCRRCVAAAVALPGCYRAPPSSPPAAAGLRLEWSGTACAAARPDLDQDGLGDRCELDLARAFAPLLVVSSRPCNWDSTVAPARLGGEYYFGVAPAPASDRVRAAYLPAYYLDCGWKGAKCILAGAGCEGHSGDSEAIVLELGYSAELERWFLEAIFLSSHCFGRSSRHCRWHRGKELGSFTWAGEARLGAPVVWVAEGTNANYPSRDACDRGHFYLDTCDRNTVGFRFPIVTERQNIGSHESAEVSAAGRGCFAGNHVGWGSGQVEVSRLECFWSDRAFRGWQRVEIGRPPTPYLKYLREVGGF